MACTSPLERALRATLPSLLVAVLACDPQPAADPAPPAPAPAVAPAAVAPGQLEVVSEEQIRAMLTGKQPGKARIVNFWAMWCQPCIAELPSLAAFVATRPDVELVLVNLDLASRRGRIPEFAQRHGVGGARLLTLDSDDPAAAIARAVPGWPNAIPVTWVFRADGTVAARYARAVDHEDLAKHL